MPYLLDAKTPQPVENCPKLWKNFFQAHSNALFQTALLLSADPEEAEANIAATLDLIDLSQPPAESEFLNVQEKLVRQTVQNTSPSGSPNLLEARSLLQSGLQPILQIERFPRVCFVLRTLLGYATSSCAQMLGIEETAFRMFLRSAVLQLHNSVAGTSSHSFSPHEHFDAEGKNEHPAVQPWVADTAAAHV